MGIIHALFGFDGRINRAPMWGYGILLTAVLIIVQGFVATSLIGPEVLAAFNNATDGPSFTQALMQLVSTIGPRLGWVSLIVQLVFSFPAAALSIKRRHDRDSSGIDVWIYLGLALVVGAAQLLGLGVTTETINGAATPVLTQPMQWLGFLLGVYALYLFIVLCFLRGTTGPNSYGPDPLGG